MLYDCPHSTRGGDVYQDHIGHVPLFVSTAVIGDGMNVVTWVGSHAALQAADPKTVAA